MANGSFFGRILWVFDPLLFGLKYLSKNKYAIYVVLGAAIVSTIARLYIPILIGDSVTSIEGLNLPHLEHFAILIVEVSVISGFFQFIVNYGSLYLGQTYSYNLRNNVFKHLLKKKFLFFENQTTGDLLSRTTMDIEASRNFITSTLSQLFPTVFMIIFGVYFLLTIDTLYAIVFIFSVPVMLYIGMVFQKKQRLHWRNIRGYYGRMNEELQENIIGQRVVRGFSAEEFEVEKFRGTTDSYYQEYIKVAELRGFYNNLLPLVLSAASTIILVYGGFFTMFSGIAVGPLVSALNIFALVSPSVSSMGRLVVFSENARAGIQRIGDILNESDIEDSVTGGSGAESSVISFENVTFLRGKRVILNNVTFSIPAGEFVGITGNTAAGKSTMVNLILRFYEPASGVLKLGGTDIRDIPLNVLRKFVTMVPQEVTLLSGTIRENIAYGSPEVTTEGVREAADIANISEFIEGLPEGYSTIIGERGITLSGGQKQRVAVARAIISHPRVLILDDATSSVDPETELEMFRKIKEKLTGTTIINVTHRHSSLKYADRILKVDRGSVILDSGDGEAAVRDLGTNDFSSGGEMDA
ncbi:MAG: ABC transporter ATP-binding protein [Thermoplasmataceae archaeon]